MMASFEDNTFDIEIATESFDMDFSEGIIVQGDRLPNYEGEYEAIPKVTEQAFPTKDRSMVDDFIVLSIPYSSVSNPQGGFTVTIGQ